jgi:hypothetical protein
MVAGDHDRGRHSSYACTAAAAGRIHHADEAQQAIRARRSTAPHRPPCARGRARDPAAALAPSLIAERSASRGHRLARRRAVPEQRLSSGLRVRRGLAACRGVVAGGARRERIRTARPPGARLRPYLAAPPRGFGGSPDVPAAVSPEHAASEASTAARSSSTAAPADRGRCSAERAHRRVARAAAHVERAVGGDDGARSSRCE